MSSEITRPNLGAFDQSDASLVRYLGLNPNNPADRAVVAVCSRYHLDPLLKHVIVIPKGGVYITRDGLLNVAHRSGQLDGIVVEQDPTLDKDAGEWVAKVTVYRKDMTHGFTYPGRYPVGGGNKQYAPEMALKAAEAHALRRAFDITGLPALDEQRPDVSAAGSRPAPMSAADFAPAVVVAEPVDEVTAEVVEPVETGEAITDAQRRALFGAFTRAGFTTDAKSAEGRTQRLAYLSNLLGRAVDSSNDLTTAEASLALDALNTDAAQAQQ